MLRHEKGRALVQGAQDKISAHRCCKIWHEPRRIRLGQESRRRHGQIIRREEQGIRTAVYKIPRARRGQRGEAVRAPRTLQNPDSPKRQAGDGRLLPGDMEGLGIISFALKAISEQ